MKDYQPIFVTAVTPCWANGGTEVFFRTLNRYFDPSRVHFVQALVYGPDYQWAPLNLNDPLNVTYCDKAELDELTANQDIVLCWGDDASKLFKPKPGRKIVMVAHGKSDWQQSVVAASAPVLDHLVTVSQHTDEGFEQYDQRTMISNAIDTTRLGQTATRAQARAALGIEQHQFTVGYLGRLHDDKGINELALAIRSANPSWRCLFCGEGPAAAALQATCNASSPGQFRWLHMTEFLGDFWAACDAACYPSHHEGFGLAAAEAAYCGIPLLHTTTGWPADQPIDEISYCTIMPNAGDILNMLQRIDRQRAKARMFAVHMRDHVIEHYLAPRQANDYAELFEFLLKR